jgi:gamma-glutamylcyclotransferase (GGCT)/AIG2-like uncharacterized protein YtfP
MPNRIFVYGSLRRSYTNRHARLLHQSATYLGKARMRGRTYQIGKYPGMKSPVTQNDWVEGEVFEIHRATCILEHLDNYEGPDYRREIHPATLRTGHEVDCWVYLYLPQILYRPD